jgi:hypothetical protein
MKKLILSAAILLGSMNTFAANAALINPIASSVVIMKIY